MLRAVRKRNASSGFSRSGAEERLGSGGRSVGPGLGSDGELLQLPEAAVATPAHHESSGVPVRRLRVRTDAAKRFKKVNNAREDALGGRETIPSSQSSRAHERCLSGSQVCAESWSTRSRRRKPPESIYTPLDMASRSIGARLQDRLSGTGVSATILPKAWTT